MNHITLKEPSDTIGLADDMRNSLGDSAIDLERFWHEGLYLRFWLVGILLAGIFLGLLATLVATEQFEATARIEIWPEAEDVTAPNSRSFRSFLADTQYFNTQYELLSSPSIAEDVIEAGNLTRNSQLIEAYQLAGSVRLDGETLGQILIDGISIEPVEQSGLVDISFVGPDPETAAMVANLWADAFLAANYNKLFGANAEAQEFLRRQISELRERLSESEQELVSYANQHEIIIVEGGSSPGAEAARETLIGTELAQLNASLANATAQRVASEARMMAGVQLATTSAAADSLRGQIARARAEVASLEASFGPSYPVLVAKKSEIVALEQALTDEVARVSGEVRAEYDAALRQEQQLRELTQAAKQEFLETQDESIQYGILSRDVETNRQLYDALLQRLKALEASGAGKNNMRLVEQANVPKLPISPLLILNLLVGLLAGAIASVLVVWLRVSLDQTVWDPADVKDRLGLALIGHVPRVEKANLLSEMSLRSSVLSEAYSSARTNITFLTPHGAPRSILLTSPGANEGKSLSAVALSASFARIGRRTLLVDADLRNSGTAQFIPGLTNCSTGLSELLAGRGALSDAIIPIPQLGFDLLPVGHLPPNPVELLAGPRLGGIIEEAEGLYDQVIVDGAPLLDLADSIETSKAVPGVVLVVEANGPKLRAIENGIARLRAANAQIYGALVTKLRPRSASYDYGYGSNYARSESAEA